MFFGFCSTFSATVALSRLFSKQGCVLAPRDQVFLLCERFLSLRNKSFAILELPASLSLKAAAVLRITAQHPIFCLLSLWTEVLLDSSSPLQPLSPVQFFAAHCLLLYDEDRDRKWTEEQGNGWRCIWTDEEMNDCCDKYILPDKAKYSWGDEKA